MRFFAAFLIAGIVASTLSTPAEARRDQRREARQQHRIREGVKSGELTKAEAAGLRIQQAKIDRAQMKAKKDGVVTPEERARLENMQDRSSQHIHNQKHDEQKR